MCRRSCKNLDWGIFCLIVQLCRETSIFFPDSTPLTSLLSLPSPMTWEHVKPVDLFPLFSCLIPQPSATRAGFNTFSFLHSTELVYAIVWRRRRSHSVDAELRTQPHWHLRKILTTRHVNVE